jgi:tetratricopeptide (TPR) repeat protein
LSVVPDLPSSSAASVPPPPPLDPFEAAIATMVDWCLYGDRPLWLVSGGPGVGKTRFVGMVAERLTREKVVTGWAVPGRAGLAVNTSVGGRKTLVIVDDAETRADVGELLATVAGNAAAGTVKVIIIARDFGVWWTQQLSRLTPEEQEVLAYRRTMIGPSGEAGPAKLDLALRTAADRNETGPLFTLATADPVSAGVLLRMAALVVALPTRVGQLRPAALRGAVRDLFGDEEGYWRRTAKEVSPIGVVQPALRAALVTSAIANADGLADAAQLLRRVPSLAVGAADRLARLAVWWHGLYGRLGAETLSRSPRLPGWLVDRVPDDGGTDSSGLSWTVATFDTERKVTEMLAQLARDAHREVWPTKAPLGTAVKGSTEVGRSLQRTVRSKAMVDEALAWLTHELELGSDELAALEEAMHHPSHSLPRTAVVLLNRLLEGEVTPSEEASLLLELGARQSELGRWEDALSVTQRAVDHQRIMVDIDREQHLVELATGVLNLGSCLAQLDRADEALEATFEAVALHRELLDTDRDTYLPNLARALSNLSSCLAKAGRRPAALGAAGQSVAIYRELAENHPRAYSRELAVAEHNWKVCREALGTPVAGRSPFANAS